MTGIVNSTGAKSGIIGTTVGTPVTDLSTATFPDGHVIQVVSIAASDVYSGAGNSFDDQIMANPSCSITLSSATNKVLVLWSLFFMAPNDTYMYCDLKRVASGTATTNNLSGESDGFGRMGGVTEIPAHFSFLDAPGVADVSITYEISYRTADDATTVFIGSSNGKTTLTAMEIVDS